MQFNSFSIFSAISQLGLLFLGASFVSNSICQRCNFHLLFVLLSSSARLSLLGKICQWSLYFNSQKWCWQEVWFHAQRKWHSGCSQNDTSCYKSCHIEDQSDFLGRAIHDPQGKHKTNSDCWWIKTVFGTDCMISKVSSIFWLQVAPFFLLGAEYGHLITLWRLCMLGTRLHAHLPINDFFFLLLLF